MAKLFQFPLQTVLNIRENIEEARAVSLKKSQEDLANEKKKLEEIEAEKNKILNKNEYGMKGKVALSVNQLQMSTDYVVQLNEMISNQTGEVVKTSQKMEKDRSELLDASKDKKIVQKLRERRHTDYLKNNRKTEEKNINEIALRIVTNKKKTGKGS